MIKEVNTGMNKLIGFILEILSIAILFILRILGKYKRGN